MVVRFPLLYREKFQILHREGGRGRGRGRERESGHGCELRERESERGGNVGLTPFDRAKGEGEGGHVFGLPITAVRWPENVTKKNQVSFPEANYEVEMHDAKAQIEDWRQLYWETHLQECLDEAAERALLPGFGGNISELEIPDSILSSIGHTRNGACHCSKLSYHCNKFGCYARCLKLQGVLCDGVTDLLRTSNLEGLVLRRIISGRQVSPVSFAVPIVLLICMVDGVVKLINQNVETLVSIALVYCKLSSMNVNMICSSVYHMGTCMHGIQYFSIKSSTIFGSKSSSAPSGLLSFLSSGRSLRAVCLADTHMVPESAAAVFEALISSCGLVSLELSGNELQGWISRIDRRFASFSRLSMSLQSLVALTLRGNNLQKNDMEVLDYVLVHMPKLRYLDLSDNPIGDDGVRKLIPYFIMAFEKFSDLSEIWMENCSLSAAGASELCQCLSTLKGQLKTLSIAYNDLGRSKLAEFLGSSLIRNLNIGDIGLGPLGFQELETALPKELSLAYINISENRGGINAAHFIYRIVSQAPNLVSIVARFNLLPSESMPIIVDAMRKSKGKLEQLDLTGNTSLCSSISKSIFSEFQFRGKPVVNLPSFVPSSSPYDDDP
ncbi:RAN GTPase-activating protein 1 [Apostasia shenzhenica]|uniref:RAN GTPase-activating protein 1 n=1 Tax=Apostasia shenzhenica TaxID=1088818 RepID=A0A2H9ZYV7_9ASPA|nr:RAN GTPase-activating protein 1 [Apostasia shenzhenica]